MATRSISISEQTVDHAVAISLANARTHAFDWADRNCALWCADYALRLTGRDPGAAWRTPCRSGAAVMRQVRREGGLAAVVGDALVAAGWAVMGPGKPRRGAIVVSRLKTDADNQVEVAGIDLGGGLAAFRLDCGLIQTRLHEPLGRWVPV